MIETPVLGTGISNHLFPDGQRYRHPERKSIAAKRARFGEDSPLSMRINPLNRAELPPPATRAQAVRDARPRCRAVLAFGGSGRLKPRAGEYLRARAAHQPLRLGSVSSRKVNEENNRDATGPPGAGEAPFGARVIDSATGVS